MKKLITSLLALAAFINLAFAQDNIILRTGEEIKAKVQEIGLADIKYKKTDNPTGPLYTILKSDVFMIKYENGTKDVFAAYQPSAPTYSNYGNKPMPFGGDYNQLRKAGTKRIVAGAVLTGLSLPMLVTGAALASTANTYYYDQYGYGYTSTNDGQMVAGIALVMTSVAALVVGPITLSKGVKYRRMARTVKQQQPTMGFTPIHDTNLERYGRAFNYNKVGTISFTF